MTYLNDVHGIIIGGTQNLVRDECTYDENDNLIQLAEPAKSRARDLSLGIIRAHGAHKIASFLREHGADVEVVDYSFSWTLEELKDFWKSRYHSKTLFLSISTTFRTSSLYIWQFAEWVREKYPHIHILGGTQSIDKVLPYKLDWYIYGYGEYGMLELIKSLRDNTSDSLTYYQVGNKRIINCQKYYRSFPKKELSISYEDRDFIESWEVLPMELARGCIFQCAFCSFPILGIREDYSRDEENFYEELKENYERWGTKHYVISDETVNDYHEKLERYASVIKRLPFKPRFGGFARGDLIAGRKKSWDTYIELGFMSHFYGIESMYRPAAKAIGKGMEVGKLQDGLLEFKEYALNNHDFYGGHISLIAGLPNETFKTLDNTYDWLQKNWKDQFSLISPLGMSSPLFTGEHAHIVDEMSNFSLIDKDPGKYGYKIIEKDYRPGSQLEWISNTGMTTKSASEWVLSKGLPLTYGSLPPWMVPEYMIDPDLDYLDMMIKTPKMRTLVELDLKRNYLNYQNNYDENDVPETQFQQQIQKHGKKELQDSIWWSLDSTRNVTIKEKTNISENNIVFASGGKHFKEQMDQYKIDFLTRYKRKKINAN